MVITNTSHDDGVLKSGNGMSFNKEQDSLKIVVFWDITPSISLSFKGRHTMISHKIRRTLHNHRFANLRSGSSVFIILLM
jgi:hypothetical protein